jgi:fimbrial chaperone protein
VLRVLLRGGTPWLFAILFGTANAGGVSVSPIRLELAPGQAATSLTVSNDTDEPRVMQVTVLRWTRENGEDRYQDAGDSDPIVTPPLFQLAPHGSQVVRLGFVQPHAAPATEQAWRVYVEEAPQAAPAPGPGQGIALRLRIGVPLFLEPASRRQALHWEAGPATGQLLHLRARNDGNVSERIDNLALAGKSGPAGKLSGPLYIFPGEHRVLDVPLNGAPAMPLRLQAKGTLAPADSDVVLPAQ